MLNSIADGVYVHESEFIQSNSTVVQGRDGVLLIDPGITREEMENLAADLRDLRLPVVAGFSTHPDWDHVLWLASFGDVPRYGTAACAETMRNFLLSVDWTTHAAELLPPEYVDDIPTELLGLITGAPRHTTAVPWDGPEIRIIEHAAHAQGHAALLIEERRVLIAGDMLSDILMPFLDLEAADPIGDYFAALDLFDALTEDVDIVVPGHGSIGRGKQLAERIGQDREYLRAVRDHRTVNDSRVGPEAPLDWLPDVHNWQVHRLDSLAVGGSKRSNH
ncbi:glyoxylase-like metal-dependent hydrolase (beta-lactamase superfamily II) [Okibacterium sp. HSC-33S16]|uniref:MBL fold metallo-hydrolase n=1 Tax=Okibacterium sp. HSC-33S16 TaxID=2910965 RepID=UPI0020A04716|nr:MBL fold metallo-hydrolase [Okibacterium sp. HSC-33S16]MCP2031974.1 glyoxylase-like metal-dependent hydrolase (beta-lactamase superfamily II) [Okibacterium sp. HSC-33S16]